MDKVSAVKYPTRGRPQHQCSAGTWSGDYLTEIYTGEDLQVVCDKKVGNHWVTEVKTKVLGYGKMLLTSDLT